MIHAHLVDEHSPEQLGMIQTISSACPPAGDL